MFFQQIELTEIKANIFLKHQKSHVFNYMVLLLLNFFTKKQNENKYNWQ